MGFQTAYSALVEGDYEKCVTNLYGSHASWPKVRVVEKLDPLPTDPTDPPVGGALRGKWVRFITQVTRSVIKVRFTKLNGGHKVMNLLKAGLGR